MYRVGDTVRLMHPRELESDDLWGIPITVYRDIYSRSGGEARIYQVQEDDDCTFYVFEDGGYMYHQSLIEGIVYKDDSVESDIMFYDVVCATSGFLVIRDTSGYRKVYHGSGACVDMTDSELDALSKWLKSKNHFEKGLFEV